MKKINLNHYWTLFQLNLKIIFTLKYVFFLAGILAYFVIIYLSNTIFSKESSGLDPEEIYNALLLFPFTILVIFFSMGLVIYERDNRTIEIMFTTSGSRYKIWLMKILVFNMAVYLSVFLFTIFIFFMLEDVSILWLPLEVMLPLLFIGNLTMLLSIIVRGDYAGGMLSAGIIFLIFIFSDPLYESRFFLFMNPYHLPYEISEAKWHTMIWQNRVGVLLLSGLLLFFSMRKLENRERLLG